MFNGSQPFVEPLLSVCVPHVWFGWLKQGNKKCKQSKLKPFIQSTLSVICKSEFLSNVTSTNSKGKTVRLACLVLSHIYLSQIYLSLINFCLNGWKVVAWLQGIRFFRQTFENRKVRKAKLIFSFIEDCFHWKIENNIIFGVKHMTNICDDKLYYVLLTLTRKVRATKQTNLVSIKDCEHSNWVCFFSWFRPLLNQTICFGLAALFTKLCLVPKMCQRK